MLAAEGVKTYTTSPRMIIDTATWFLRGEAF